MPGPEALDGESKVGNANDEREEISDSATENRGVTVTTNPASFQQNLVKYDLCQISGTNQQNINFQKRNSLQYSVLKKCIECSNIKETSESCFNMLETKLGQVGDAHFFSFGTDLEHLFVIVVSPFNFSAQF